MDPPPRAQVSMSGLDGEMRQLKDHQQTREELLNRVHSLKAELHDWRYKMDAKVKNYKGELSELKDTLHNETEALRRELEETSARLKRQISRTRDNQEHRYSAASSPSARLNRAHED